MEKYDYYKSVKEKSDKLALTIFKQNDEILKAKLYNLVLNLCNQVIYDFTYVLTKEDLFFIADYNNYFFKTFLHHVRFPHSGHFRYRVVPLCIALSACI